MKICLFFLLFLLAPLAHAAEPQEGILLVAFGTSYQNAKAAYDTIENEYRKQFPDSHLVWAFTSQKIRKKLAKQGINTNSIAEGLDQLARQGVKNVRVQSLHITSGEEFDGMARSVLLDLQKHPGRFDSVFLARPLLETREDADGTARAIAGLLADSSIPVAKDIAILLMAHGNAKGRSELVLTGAHDQLRKSMPNIYMASVEEDADIPMLGKDLLKNGFKRVVLLPLMIVAGDHAQNDMAGSDKDSWASQLESSGLEVLPVLKGLGEAQEISSIFARHTRESGDNLCLEPRKP